MALLHLQEHLRSPGALSQSQDMHPAHQHAGALMLAPTQLFLCGFCDPRLYAMSSYIAAPQSVWLLGLEDTSSDVCALYRRKMQKLPTKQHH